MAKNRSFIITYILNRDEALLSPSRHITFLSAYLLRLTLSIVVTIVYNENAVEDVRHGSHS
jgi:hypothetical protein